MIQNMTEEHKAVALLMFANIGSIISKVSLGDILTYILTLAQVLVAVATALWFFAKWRGVRLDNTKKESKLNEKNTRRPR